GQDVGDLVTPRDGLLRDPVWRQARDVLAVEDDAARGWTEDTGQAIEERRLAGAVGADDRPDLALNDGDRNLVKGGQPSESNGEPLGPEDWRVAGHATRTCTQAGRSSSPSGSLPGVCACCSGS